MCAIRRNKHEMYCIFDKKVPSYAYIGLTSETLELVHKILLSSRTGAPLSIEKIVSNAKGSTLSS